MDSFAFWYHSKDQNPNVSAVMNFNLWSECGWSGEPMLDIGFRITNLKQAETLYFFLPLLISESEKTNCIEDLGCKFKKTELVDAVFNESYATTIASNTKVIEVQRTDDPDAFKIYQLDIEHDIGLEHFADGTIVSIATKTIIPNPGDDESNADYYFRFRIKNKPLPFLIHKYASSSKVVQSMFNTTYMIDFRYHNIRSLDKTLIERFSKNGNHIVAVSSLHFLLMTKAYVEVGSGDFNSVRKIEKDVWKNYVDQDDTEDLVAYHYSHKPNEKDIVPSSELFAKFRVENSLVLQYIFFTILLGASGSFIGSIVFEMLKPWLISIGILANGL